MAILNIGILAHVDAGKTSLTERILFETGVIPSVGSVDKGTTQTDTLEIERARGITIRSAVVSFRLDNLKINLIDTPGHGDFVAEVERSLRVLDAVILVISSVEGVQSQTRRLARAIRSAGLPMLIFVNKIDRLGARSADLLYDIQRKLHVNVIPLNVATSLGDRSASIAQPDRDSAAWLEQLADILAQSSEQVIEEFDRNGGRLSRAYLEGELRAQVAAGDIVPAYFGSALTGVGVTDVLAGISEWLPEAEQPLEGTVKATVFKITRRPSGEKIVFVRVFAGGLTVRQWITIQRREMFGEFEAIEERVTGIGCFEAGGTPPADEVHAGDIACLHGLREAKIGDRIGDDDGPLRILTDSFAAPKLESVVRPVNPDQITHLRTALEELAEQDPLISLRQRNDAGDISVRLYGEVQKEVMAETLLREYGISVTFGDSQTICIERPAGHGEHVDYVREGENPFYATVGLRIEPAPPGSGVRYERQLGSLPLAFYRAIEESMYQTLEQGLCGWEITDCVVTLTEVGYIPITTAADFRKLTPMVLMSALDQATTTVYEPIERLELEIPQDTYGAVCGVLINARGTIGDTRTSGSICHMVSEVPSSELRNVEHKLPGLTRGEGGWDSTFAGYIPVTGEPPQRKRIGPNPLHRTHYLAEIAQGV